MRTAVPLLAALALGAPGSACSRPAGDAARPRDVFLIVVDTLRADHLGCYGYTRPTSPAIDALGREGAVFERAVSASAFTGPSVASILTGRYPRFHSFGLANGKRRLEDAETTLAERFAEAGYRTGAVVSNPVLPRRFGFAQGFEHYDLRLQQLELVRQVPERTAERTTAAAIEWLGTLGADEPVFLWVHYMDPHGPYTPPEDLRAAFAPADPGREIAPPPGENVNSGLGHVPWYQAIRDEHRLDEYVGRYDAEIAAVDREIERLLGWLEANGRYDDAVILLTSDHGEALGEGDYYFCHGQGVTPDQSFVPMILKHPGIAAGTRVAEPAGHVDVYRTLTDELGLASQAGLERAVDLAELARGAPGDAAPRALYCSVRSALGVFVEDAILISLLAGEEGFAGPDDVRSQRLIDRCGEPLADDGRQAALAELAHRYLSRTPGAFADPVEDAEMETTLRELGYTGSDD